MSFVKQSSSMSSYQDFIRIPFSGYLSKLVAKLSTITILSMSLPTYLRSFLKHQIVNIHKEIPSLYSVMSVKSEVHIKTRVNLIKDPISIFLNSCCEYHNFVVLFHYSDECQSLRSHHIVSIIIRLHYRLIALRHQNE
jgi:hypothetical protein